MPPVSPATEPRPTASELATKSRLPLYGGLLACAAMFAYSWIGDHYLYFADDAGITMRYAERMAAGLGFAYNDGEAVNGASNPLYVFTAAALLRLGLSPEATILFIASASLAAIAGVMFATFARFYSVGAAAFSVLALVAFEHPFNSIADGMESPLVMLFAVLLFRALHGGGHVFPGIALGLLVANKLDGALAAVAFTAVYLLARRSFPWREALTALLTAAPVFGVLLASFGSILPNSMIVKLTIHSQYAELDRLWMPRMLLLHTGLRLLFWSSFWSLLWLPLARELRRSFAIAVIQLWFLLHLGAYAVLNLGDTYPWYTAAPQIHCVILSSFAVHVLASAVLVRGRFPRFEWDPRRLPRRAWPVGLLCFVALAWSRHTCLISRLEPPSPPHGLADSASDNLGRQAAGAWLRKHTSGTELLSTFEGLPAYEYGGPVYDFSRLNSARDDAREAGATYLLEGPLEPDVDPPLVLGGRDLICTFRFDTFRGPYCLYASPGSEIDASGARHLVFPTPDLQFGRPGGERWLHIEPANNAWRMPAGKPARFGIKSPAAPTLLFTPRLGSDRPVLPGDSARVVVRSNGAELDSGEITSSSVPRALRFTAPERLESDAYFFEIECTYTGTEDGEPCFLQLEDILLRCGEPLRSADFKVTQERARARIDYVATSGLPCNLFGP